MNPNSLKDYLSIILIGSRISQDYRYINLIARAQNRSIVPELLLTARVRIRVRSHRFCSGNAPEHLVVLRSDGLDRGVPCLLVQRGRDHVDKVLRMPASVHSTVKGAGPVTVSTRGQAQLGIRDWAGLKGHHDADDRNLACSLAASAEGRSESPRGRLGAAQTGRAKGRGPAC
jgi:hypothetical protein